MTEPTTEAQRDDERVAAAYVRGVKDGVEGFAALAARPSADTEVLRARLVALADEWDDTYGGTGEFGLGVDSGLQRAAEALRAALDAR